MPCSLCFVKLMNKSKDDAKQGVITFSFPLELLFFCSFLCLCFYVFMFSFLFGFAFFVGLNEDLKKIQLLENKADSPKGNLLFALLFSSNKRLYA